MLAAARASRLRVIFFKVIPLNLNVEKPRILYDNSLRNISPIRGRGLPVDV